MALKDDNKGTQLIETASREWAINTFAAVSGVAVSFLNSSDPMQGAVIGVYLRETLKTVLSTVSNSYLSQREKVRVGGLAAFAISSVAEKINQGATLRGDGFFKQLGDNTRSSAEELFEGVLLKAKNEHEERKLKHLGILYSWFCFRPEITASDANHMIKIFEGLSYRQLCILAVLGDAQTSPRDDFRPEDLTQFEDDYVFPYSLTYQETYQLIQSGLVLQRGGGGPKDFSALSDWTWIEPKQLVLSQNIGAKIYELAELSLISYADREEAEKAFRWQSK